MEDTALHLSPLWSIWGVFWSFYLVFFLSYPGLNEVLVVRTMCYPDTRFAVDRSERSTRAAHVRGSASFRFSFHLLFLLIFFFVFNFFASLTFLFWNFMSKYFFSKFHILDFFAGPFLLLNFACAKILDYDFSFQKLSISKYSSPNFT